MRYRFVITPVAILLVLLPLFFLR